ncbi:MULTISPECIES: helix-turn-helix transcriptional regulator [unclassified Streptomyces]|uniref:helix-turn-helix domain-containing protein n=1 Tax=unclassified Streptomyces TaxID=2593676 RepID=UPI00202564EC|nr:MULTISPECIES: helix-turn-helix transcriptional regulator [unclassified Streptomyces]MCX4550531.1 helix-turn-helix transcriptional regulator [Streptomyces sp. NBC_01500]WSC21978.1 helix-turn-helix transcriptional regulator [Streptomyces sp. NBC_01766]
MTPREPTATVTAQFAAFLTRAAVNAGFDTTRGTGGRRALAEASGMSPSAISRTLDGKTLPRPSQLEGLARAVRVDVRELMIESGVISPEAWTDRPEIAVRSETLSPEDAADVWGIHDPMVRAYLISNIRQAQNLQAEADQTTAQDREVSARG